MGSHHRGTGPGSADERPSFDEVAHGYDPRQVDDYLLTLWRYASSVTSRAAAAESALRHERERQATASTGGPGAAGGSAAAGSAAGGAAGGAGAGFGAGAGTDTASAGTRIGQMLAIAQREAEDIIEGARRIAESTLEEVIEDAGANHPIVREAREQAEKLLLDAVEESRQIAHTRHLELQEQIARAAATLDVLRHQQGEIIGAVLRLRAVLGSDEIDRAVTDLARAGSGPTFGAAGGPSSFGPTASAGDSASASASTSGGDPGFGGTSTLGGDPGFGGTATFGSAGSDPSAYGSSPGGPVDSGTGTAQASAASGAPGSWPGAYTSSADGVPASGRLGGSQPQATFGPSGAATSGPGTGPTGHGPTGHGPTGHGPTGHG
uniref:ATP synthase F0 subunit B n=1 Tax=Candidatus Frankia nodulisporulans TaxID=2060052 RepID=UPI0013D415FD